MLPRHCRLSKKTEIATVKTKQHYSGATNTLFFKARKNSLKTCRLASVVPKSLGNAVKRNKLRRCIAAAVCKIFPFIEPKIDMLFYPRHTALLLNSAEMAREMVGLFKQAKVLSEDFV